MYEIFSDVTPPHQNSGAAPVYSIYTVYLCCHLCPPKFLYVADPVVCSIIYALIMSLIMLISKFHSILYNVHIQ